MAKHPRRIESILVHEVSGECISQSANGDVQLWKLVDETPRSIASVSTGALDLTGPLCGLTSQSFLTLAWDAIEERRWSDLLVVQRIELPFDHSEWFCGLGNVTATSDGRWVAATRQLSGSLYMIDWSARPALAHEVEEASDIPLYIGEHPMDAAFFPNGKTLVIVSLETDGDPCVTMYSVDQGTIERQPVRLMRDLIETSLWSLRNGMLFMAVDPGGQRIATWSEYTGDSGSVRHADAATLRGEVVCYDATSGKPLWCRAIDKTATQDPRPNKSVPFSEVYYAQGTTNLQFTSDCKHLILGSISGQVLILDAGTGDVVVTIPSPHRAGPAAIGISNSPRGIWAGFGEQMEFFPWPRGV